MIVLQPPLLCEGWGGHPLCLSWDSSVLIYLHWPCSCTAQSSSGRFSICRSSLRHFPERSWTVVAFPCFTVVKSFTSWYAVLLRFSSISLHYSPIQFSLAFFMHLFFTSFFCISQILQAQIFSFSVHAFCRTDQKFQQWSRVFLLMMFAKDLTGCFSYCCVEGGDHWIHVCISIIHDGERSVRVRQGC